MASSKQYNSSLQAEWEIIQAEAPDDPKGMPTQEQLAFLRAHKLRVKAFLEALPEKDRQTFQHQAKEKKRLPRVQKSDPVISQESKGEEKNVNLKGNESAVAPTEFTNNPVADELSSRLGCKPQYLSRDGSSWVIHCKGWMPAPGEEAFDWHWRMHPVGFHELKLFGKSFYENRYSQSWGHNYRYSGTVSHAAEICNDDENSEMVRCLIDRVNVLTSGVVEGNTEKPYNGCLQNWYEPDHTIGLHSDDERDLRNGYPIFSLSWGGTRRFVLKARADSPTSCVSKLTEVMLSDGDLLVMGGRCQQTHKHEVPKPRVTKDPPTSRRINWTIRAFVPHVDE